MTWKTALSFWYSIKKQASSPFFGMDACFMICDKAVYCSAICVLCRARLIFCSTISRRQYGTLPARLCFTIHSQHLPCEAHLTPGHGHGFVLSHVITEKPSFRNEIEKRIIKTNWKSQKILPDKNVETLLLSAVYGRYFNT